MFSRTSILKRSRPPSVTSNDSANSSFNSGSTSASTRCTVTFEVCLFSGQIFRVVLLRKFHLEGRFVAALTPTRPFSKSGNIWPAPSTTGYFLASPPGKHFAFETANEIDRDAIAVCTLAIDLFPAGFLLAQAWSAYRRHRLIANGDHRLFDLDLLEILEHNLGHDLEGCDVREGLDRSRLPSRSSVRRPDSAFR